MPLLFNENSSDQLISRINTLVLEYILGVENEEENSRSSHQLFIENIQQQYDDDNVPIRVRVCYQQFKKTMRELAKSSNIDPQIYKKRVLNYIDIIRLILSEVPEDEFSSIFIEASFSKPDYISKITKWEDDLRKNILSEDLRDTAASKLLNYVQILTHSLPEPRLISIISDGVNNDIRSIGSFISEAISEIPLIENPPSPPREQEELRQALNILTPFSETKKPTSRFSEESTPDIAPPGLDTAQIIVCDSESDEDSQPSQLFVTKTTRTAPSKTTNQQHPSPHLFSNMNTTSSSNISPSTSSAINISTPPTDQNSSFSDKDDESVNEPSPPRPIKKRKIAKIKLSKDELQEAVKAIAKKERRSDVSFTFKNQKAWAFIESRVYGDDVSILGDSIIEEDTREPGFSPQRWKRRHDGKAARYWTKSELTALWEGFKEFDNDWNTIYHTYKNRFHITRHPGSLSKKFKRTIEPLIINGEVDWDQLEDE